jgi:hypothetical protein
MEYPAMWKPLSQNDVQQRESRRKILCQVDRIIPGHGPMFEVSAEMRKMMHCDLLS